MVRQRELGSEPTIGTRANVILARTEGGFVASWPKIEAPDAGTDPTPALAGFEVVDLDPRGELVRRELVPSPPPLKARKGSIEDAGIAREHGATLVHWTESATTTDPDGRVRTAFTFRTAYADRVLDPPAAACERCAMLAAVVSFADETIAFVRTEADVTLDVELGKPPRPPVFTGLRLRRDATVETVSLPWMSLEPQVRTRGAQVLQPALLNAHRDLEGNIVVTTDGHAWRVDRAFRPIGGPIPLPATDARALFGPAAASEASIVWSVAANEDGRSTAELVRREIFVANGSIRDRLTHGRALLAAERRDDEIGVVFESAGRAFFAASSATGKKRGGDVFVWTVEAGGSQFGPYAPQDLTVIASPSTGRFTLVDLGRGSLSSTEIVCAP